MTFKRLKKDLKMKNIVEWIEKGNGSEQELIFMRKLEQMFKTEYKNCTLEHEFSIQCVEGLHRIIIDNKYIIDFDYYTELHTIYEKGAESAAELYFNKIKEQIKEI